MRKQIALTPLAKSTSETEIIAFDTEDNGRGVSNKIGDPNNFICASFYSQKKIGKNEYETLQKSFFDRDEAREFILQKRSHPVIFFAHNLAYDLGNMDYPEGCMEQIVTKSKLVGATYRYNKKVIRFMDTANFFAFQTIHALGKMVGVNKIGCQCEIYGFNQETGLCDKCNDFTIKSIKDKTHKDLTRTLLDNCVSYCVKDAEICFKTANNLLSLCNENQTRFKSYTNGSLSLRVFRTNFMTQPWKVRPQRINDFERTAYYGGRTEVFNYNKHPEVHYEDITSSYPTAMYYKMLPVPWSCSTMKNPTWSKIKDFQGISLVTIKAPKLKMSQALPYKTPEEGKLIFPHGKWTASYVHEELKMAEKYGYEIEEVHDCILYSESFNPFKEYIDCFFKKKNQCSKCKCSEKGLNPIFIDNQCSICSGHIDDSRAIEREFYKLLMNSLSGKLGEKRDKCIRVLEKDFMLCYCENTSYKDFVCTKCNKYKITTQTYEPDENGWININIGRSPDPVHSFPCLIAYITAYGRIKLFEDQLRHQDAIYCDTDSYVSTVKHEVNRGKELGQWDAKPVQNFIAYSPKFYYMEENGKPYLKLKGVPKSHIFFYRCINGHITKSPPCVKKCTINHHEQIKFCSECNEKVNTGDCYYYDRPLKMAEAIRRKKKPNMWQTLEKIVSLDDNKRVKLPNGDSEPIFINDVSVFSFNEQIEKYMDDDLK